MSDTTETHVAGVPITYDRRTRQRCSWCGVLILDYDGTEQVAVTDSEDLDLPLWEPGGLVRIQGDMDSRYYMAVEQEESVLQAGAFKAPEDSCFMRLHPEVTL